MRSTNNVRKIYQPFLKRGFLIVFLCFSLTGCGPEHVATADSEYEANAMFDILDSNGFDVIKVNPEGERKTWEIQVDEGLFGGGEAAAAIKVLRDYGLPRPPEPDVKEDDSLGMNSENKEKDQQRRNRQLEFERQFYTLPDVIGATVIIAPPDDDVFETEKSLPTATVTLILKVAEPKFTREDIQKAVSGGVTNLKPENVNVLFVAKPVREIQRDKLDAHRRQNTIFAIGFGIVILLTAILGAVWIYTRKRRKNLSAENEQLIVRQAEEADEFEEAEPTLLDEENQD